MNRAVVSVVVTLACHASFAEDTPPMQECDRLAASPLNAEKGVVGTPFEEIDAPKAIIACAKAIQQYPDRARFHFQYARALHKARQYDAAHKAYRRVLLTPDYWAISSNNIGSLYEEQGDYKAALTWYESAAEKGLSIGRNNAALVLASGAGLAAPDFERAAVHWQALAKEGDPAAAEKLVFAVFDKKISPIGKDKMLTYLKFAADHKRVKSAIAYSFIPARNGGPRTADERANYALEALRLSTIAPQGSDDAWPVFQLHAFHAYERALLAGAKQQMESAIYAKWKLDFSVTGDTVLDLEDAKKCNGQIVSLYFWDWSRSYPSTDLQIKWYADRGCIIPDEYIQDLKEVWNESRRSNTSYTELAYRTFLPAEQREAKVPLAPTRQNGLTDNQKLGLSAFALGACYIWSKACKELAWEATKEVVREGIRKNRK